MTSILFDFLEEILPEGPMQREIHEFNVNNVLILDLRDQARRDVVDLIVSEFPSYLDNHAVPDARAALQDGYGELFDLAAKQQARNRNTRM
jgi:hypothetical protein